METGTALTVLERASLALGASEHEKRLVALAKQSHEIVEITNKASYTQLHTARMALKTERVNLEKLGKAAREDASKFARAVIAEEARLVAIIEPEEARLEAIQGAYDNRIAAEKAAREQAERDRIATIQAAIDDLRAQGNSGSVLDGAERIARYLEDCARRGLPVIETQERKEK